ncbi:MAG: glutamine-synthetase adenylyltransferase, partial [Alphaproteobacteria bacterium]|nr:glutamine-synthetase adenylyltransferase [Alphaproteobacteria bacterium]
MDKIEQAIFRAQAHSPYLRALIAQFPDIVEMVRAGAAPGGLDAKLPVPKRLRMAKRRLALHVGLADLAGIMSLEVVMRQLSDFADAALDVALEAAFAAVVPGQPPQGFAILALGKQGSHELNYSSDIDPIFIFDPETLPRRSKDEPIETAIRIARHLLDTMQTRDADGYVLRVDMRLRPYPEATALAVPLEAAIRYYESAAEPWERAAFIRARACAGDVALGQNFLQVIQPFIWRRALDFGVRTEIDAIVSRIRDHAEDRQAFGPGFDLKRGHGGIREVEFYAQIHQLIHGGRDPALRVGATLDALAVLERAGRIAPDEAARLAAAYRIYRSIEHRLQMVNDQQTHRLPLDEAALENVAHLHGLKSGAALLELLAPHVDAVGAIFDTMTPRTPGAFPRDGAHIEQALKALGFKQRGDVARRISGWRSGKYRTVRSAAARAGLEAVLPALLKAFAACAAPLTAINRFDQMLEGLPSAVNLFALLNAQPPLLDMLVRILSLAPALSEELARRANLLDGLIDASALAPLPDVAALVAALAHPDVQADLEMVLERVRLLVGEKRFALGVQIILGIRDPLEVARGYARLAEAAVHVITACVVRGYEQVHGRVAGSELLILALGRLGGGELTHKSDLDLVFIFTGDYRGTS